MPKRVSSRRRFSPTVENRNKRQSRARFWHRSFLVFVSMVFLSAVLAVVWYGTRFETFTITDVKVEGGDTISHEKIKEIAKKRLEGEYYHIVPRRFSFTYPAKEITAEIKALSRVKDVTVELSNKNTVLIKITEYYPFALWCKSKSDDLSACFFLDADGYSFIEAPVLNGGSMLRYFDQRIEPKAAEQPFTSVFMSDTSRLALVLARDFNFPVTHVERTAPDEVIYYLPSGSYIKASLRQSVDSTTSNLSTILGSADFKHLEPGNFLYIDLRFGNKVFVNEGMEESVSTSTANSL